MNMRSVVFACIVFVLSWLAGYWYYAPVRFEEIKEDYVWITAVQHEYSYINRVSKSMDKEISSTVDKMETSVSRKENLDEFLANVLSVWELSLNVIGDPYIVFAMTASDISDLKNKRIKITGKTIKILLDSEYNCKEYIKLFRNNIKSASYKEIFE